MSRDLVENLGIVDSVQGKSSFLEVLVLFQTPYSLSKCDIKPKAINSR